MSEEAGFLSRWARRKQAALRGEAPTEPPAEAPVALPEAPPPSPPPLAEASPPALRAADDPAYLGPDPDPGPTAAAPEPFDVASLPPVDLLDAASDFTAFLRPGVPAALRSAALRKAWTADPLIRDYLSPLDYGWDFNKPGGLPFGFADTLGEGAEKVLRLVRQAVGEPEPPPEEGTAPLEAIPPSPPLEELPASPELLAEATPLETQPPEAQPGEAEPQRWRHGGALPA